MKNLLISMLVLCGVATGQTRIKPPQPDYARYGSLHDQLVVYENMQRRLDALELQRYRRFREEVRRQVPRVETRVIVARNRGCEYQYGDAMRLWRERR